MNKKNLIQDNESKICKLPYFLRKMFIKTYYYQGFIYITSNFLRDDIPAHYSTTVKWLDKLKIESYSEKRATMLSFKYFNEKYPEYKNFINLF
jgi:hypothetical protein